MSRRRPSRRFVRKGIPTRTKTANANIRFAQKERRRRPRNPRPSSPYSAFSESLHSPSRARWRPRVARLRADPETSSSHRPRARDGTPRPPARNRARARRSPRGPPSGSPPCRRSCPRCRASGRSREGSLSSANRICSGIAPRRRRRLERVLPEVAHDAAPRALAIREEDRSRRARVPPPGRGSSSTKKPDGRTGSAAFRGGRSAEDERVARPAVRGLEVDHAAPAYRERNAARYWASVAPKRCAKTSSPPAPCWKRRFGKTGIAKPVIARTPRDAISPFSA